MTWAKQNRGRVIAAFAAMMGAGTVFGTYALAATGPVRFDPFAPTRLDTMTAGNDTSGGTAQPLPPAAPPSRPPIRDPFRPPSRSPFTP